MISEVLDNGHLTRFAWGLCWQSTPWWNHVAEVACFLSRDREKRQRTPNILQKYDPNHLTRLHHFLLVLQVKNKTFRRRSFGDHFTSKWYYQQEEFRTHLFSLKRFLLPSPYFISWILGNGLIGYLHFLPPTFVRACLCFHSAFVAKMYDITFFPLHRERAIMVCHNNRLQSYCYRIGEGLHKLRRKQKAKAHFARVHI